jgi:hypothetical protein
MSSLRSRAEHPKSNNKAVQDELTLAQSTNLSSYERKRKDRFAEIQGS